jgi:tetratricopeptide (TPR) repeat protein
MPVKKIAGMCTEAYIKALRYYDEAIKLNPNSTIAWNRKGIALAELGNYTDSIACFERAILINSSQAEAYNNKGASLDNLGNHTQALKCYDNATKLDPLMAEAWYNMAKTLALDPNSFLEAQECYMKAIELNPDLEGEQLIWIYTRGDLKII